MKNPIYPCLWFDGQAKAAAEFYCSLFPNSNITADTPMVVMCELDGNKLMGLNGGPMFKINPAVSLSVTCESVAATNALWDKLIVGGKAMIPIDKQPWSERYGWLQDQFGLTWQISVGEKLNIVPAMLFDGPGFGRAEEAINFYSTVFDNSGTEMMVHYPTNDANAGKVMFSKFKLNRQEFIAMDGPGAHDYVFNEAVSFVVNCDTQPEIDNYWNKLIAGGGEESMCGWLKDKFGVSWQIVPAVLGKLMMDSEKAPRVTQAFMKMKKMDIATLLNA